MSKVIKLVDYDEITQAIEQNKHTTFIASAFAGLIDEFAKKIYQNEDVRTAQQVLAHTNVASITWGSFEAPDYLGHHAWSYPLVKLKSGEEFEVDENGVVQELHDKLTGSEESINFIVDFLNNDVLANANCFSDTAYVEIVPGHTNVDIGAIVGSDYSGYFLLWVGELMTGRAH